MLYFLSWFVVEKHCSVKVTPKQDYFSKLTDCSTNKIRKAKEVLYVNVNICLIEAGDFVH